MIANNMRAYRIIVSDNKDGTYDVSTDSEVNAEIVKQLLENGKLRYMQIPPPDRYPEARKLYEALFVRPLK